MKSNIHPKSAVHNMDCMEGMKQYPDKYFDLAVCDLEYGIGASKPTIKPCVVKQKNGSLLKVKQPNYTPKEWDFKMSDSAYFEELFRISEKQIIFGGNYYGLAGGYLCWDKLNGDTDQYGCELAWLSFTTRTDIVYYRWSGMIQGAAASTNITLALNQIGDKTKNEVRIHPTQKPVKLYEWIFNEYAKSGDKIVDTHLGSGSSRIAADKIGLEFTGFEKDLEYFDASVKRYENHIAQLTIF